METASSAFIMSVAVSPSSAWERISIMRSLMVSFSICFAVGLPDLEERLRFSRSISWFRNSTISVVVALVGVPSIALMMAANISFLVIKHFPFLPFRRSIFFALSWSIFIVPHFVGACQEVISTFLSYRLVKLLSLLTLLIIALFGAVVNTF